MPAPTKQPLQDNAGTGLHQPASAVLVELYEQAFEHYGTLCLWSTRKFAQPTLADVLDTADRLKRKGTMESRQLAVKIEDLCRAVV